MTDFDSNSCVNKLLQGCTYTAGKCPCRLKKTASEEEYDRNETYVKTHWKSVVLCSECENRRTDKCPMYLDHWNYALHDYEIIDKSYPDGWCFMGEK